MAVPTHSTFTLTLRSTVNSSLAVSAFWVETADVESDGDVVGDGRACAGSLRPEQGALDIAMSASALTAPSKLLGGLHWVWSWCVCPASRIRPQELAVSSAGQRMIAG